MQLPFTPRTNFNYRMQSGVPQGVDVLRLAKSIKNNETGIVKSNPYSFSRPANDKTKGNANGAYQVTDAELQTYAPRYLGRAVTSQQFLSNPTLQDMYMHSKIANLSARGLTPAQILAVHRGGGSDLTPEGLNGAVPRWQPYVNNGMSHYSQMQTVDPSSEMMGTGMGQSLIPKPFQSQITS